MKRSLRTLDLFCGAGGSSWGARAAGAEIIAGFDKCPVAGEAFMDNFEDAWFYEGDLSELSASSLKHELGAIDLILASPECTNHSVAKGNIPRCEKSRKTAFHVVEYAKKFNPRWLVIENVTNMRRWHRYSDLVSDLEALGYNLNLQILNSVDFGVPQTRKRMFLLCDRETQPRDILPTSNEPVPAASFVNQNGRYSYSRLRTPKRAKATLERANRAIRNLGKETPFLIVYYGSDKAGGWQSLERPLRTITTLDRFGFVKREGRYHVMRMLQVPELKAAMGMPQRFSVGSTTRRNGIRVIGNAVCPPVMKHVVQQLTRS